MIPSLNPDEHRMVKTPATMHYILSPGSSIPPDKSKEIPVIFGEIKEVLQDDEFFEEWKDLFAEIPSWKAMRCPDGTIICTDPEENLSDIEFLYEMPHNNAFQHVGGGSYGTVFKYAATHLHYTGLVDEFCLKEIPITNTKDDYKLFFSETCLNLTKKNNNISEQMDSESKKDLKRLLKPWVDVLKVLSKTITKWIDFPPLEEYKLQKFFEEKHLCSLTVDKLIHELLGEYDHKISNATIESFRNFVFKNAFQPHAAMCDPVTIWVLLDPKQKKESEPVSLIIQTYFCNTTMAEYMKEQRIRNSEFKSFKLRYEITNVIYNLLSALALFHKQNGIHRDIKPSNIFGVKAPLSFNDTVLLEEHHFQPTIGDFSIARRINDGELIYENLRTTNLNRDRYAAPEIFISGKGYSKPVDVYALGVIYYELLSGKSYDEEVGVSKEFLEYYKEESAVLLRLIDPEPRNRITAEEAVKELVNVRESIEEERKKKGLHIKSLIMKRKIPIHHYTPLDEMNLERYLIELVDIIESEDRLGLD